MPGVV